MTVSLGKTGDTFVWPVVIKGTIGLAAGCCPFILIPVVGVLLCPYTEDRHVLLPCGPLHVDFEGSSTWDWAPTQVPPCAWYRQSCACPAVVCSGLANRTLRVGVMWWRHILPRRGCRTWRVLALCYPSDSRL